MQIELQPSERKKGLCSMVDPARFRMGGGGRLAAKYEYEHYPALYCHESVPSCLLVNIILYRYRRYVK